MGCGSSVHVPKVNASDEFDVADDAKDDNGLRVLKLVLVGVRYIYISLVVFLPSPHPSLRPNLPFLNLASIIVEQTADGVRVFTVPFLCFFTYIHDYSTFLFFSSPHFPLHPARMPVQERPHL